MRSICETCASMREVITPKAVFGLGEQPDSIRKAATEKTSQERLQGTWKCAFQHCGGVKSEPDLTCTIKGNTFENKLTGQTNLSGTFKLVDLDASPKQIEWVITFAASEEDKDKSVSKRR